MPDIQSFTVTGSGTASVSLPSRTISFKVCDSRTGEVLQDFTGVNALSFPGVIANLTVAQRNKLSEMMMDWLIRWKLGLE